jgi:hypothetical protein
MFHCHLLVHLASGMAMAFDVRHDEIPEAQRVLARESCAPVGGVHERWAELGAA